MNAGIKMVFRKVNMRIPKGNHALKPYVMQGPNAHLGKKNVSPDRRMNPKDRADYGKKILLKVLSKDSRRRLGYACVSGNTSIAQTAHP